MKHRVRTDIVRRQPLLLKETPRPVVRAPRADVPKSPLGYRRPSISLNSRGLWPGSDSDPYVDFGNFLTGAGGILLSFKDRRWRYTFWRILAWTLSTGGEAWFVIHHSPLHTPLANYLVLLAGAIINWLIVAKPVEIYRKVEIRSDCMIIDGVDLFWRRHMEVNWPRFTLDSEGNKLLTGIYGTRWVEYFTCPRFDEADRSPEVLESHLTRAMQQLWTKPLD